MRLLMLVFEKRAPRLVDGVFRRGQLFSAAVYSIGHGGNDAQKTAGIIMAALVATGYAATDGSGKLHVPPRVILACHAAMGLGTLAGGWRIVRTLGMRVTKPQPVGGFAAETSGAASLLLATGFGIPVSTTHTITGSIVGVGTVRKLSAVRWGIAGRIVWAWVLTIPGSAAIAAASYVVARALGVHG
jgi:PiT family inorganic phosphate transporter